MIFNPYVNKARFDLKTYYTNLQKTLSTKVASATSFFSKLKFKTEIERKIKRVNCEKEDWEK